MRNLIFLTVSAFLVAGCLLVGCDKDNGGRQPLPPVDITINPNSTIYDSVNAIGGWMYLGEWDGVEPPSRGIILYRASLDEFLAFERTPPFKPDSCCNAQKTVCSRLLVDQYFPFIMDTCTASKYLILDGSVVEGPSNMSLSMYITEYDGNLLYIHN